MDTRQASWLGRSRAVAIGSLPFVILLAILLTACESKQRPPPVTLIKPPDLSGKYVRQASDVSLPVPLPIETDPARTVTAGPPLLGVPPTKLTAPSPIPDRLLVKIARSEIADPFQRGDPVPDLVKGGFLPGQLGVSGAEYLGSTPRNEVLMGLRFARPVMRAQVEAAFRGKRVRIVDTVSTPRDKQGFRAATLAFAGQTRRLLDALKARAGHFYLKRSSPLNPAFRTIGAVSMRRIFRGVERPVPGRPGFFTVRRFKDILAFAKRAYPQRAKRAFSYKATRPVPEGPQSVSRAVEADRLKLPASLQERIDGPVRTGEGYPVVVAENMENWFILRLPPGTDLKKARQALSRLARVERIAFDYPVTPQTQDPQWANQWGMDNTGAGGGVAGFDINVETAWSAGSPVQSVVVAVVDTGINENLSELSDRLWSNPAEAGGVAGVDDDCNGYIDDVHGITTYDRWIVDYGDAPCNGSPGGASQAFDPHATQVAGVIAAKTDNSVGVAGTAGTDDVQLMNVALGTFSGSAFPPGYAEVSEALGYAISPSYEIGADLGTLPPGADIVNMSFRSSGCNYLFYEVLEAALDNGMILVASTGNEGIRFTRTETLAIGVFPASLPGVIAVGGATRMDRHWDQANYGPGLDLVAPAHEITTIAYDPATPGQTQPDIVTVSGTSLAAAFVSGGAAVVLGRYPDITAPYMRHWLRAKARDMLDPNGDGVNDPGDDEWSGAGLLDVGTAVTARTNPADVPLDVQVKLQRSENHIRWWIGGLPPLRPDAVGGSPNLGVRVEGASQVNWSLAYGVGDAPTSWTDITVTGADPNAPADYSVSASGISGGNNSLNTDPLPNGQMHTLRLLARNAAGTEFTAYDWFVPLRARITVPEPNWSMIPERGWMPVGAFVDTRPGSGYTVTVLDDLDQTVWASGPLSAYTSGSDTMGLAAMLPPGTPFVGIPTFPSPPPFTAEGWYKVRLSVQSPAGTDEDTVRFYVDRSNYPGRYWPVQHLPVSLPQWGDDYTLDQYPLSMFQRYQDWLEILDYQAGLSPRLLVMVGKTVFALDSNGALVWEHTPLGVPPFHFEHEFSRNLVVDTSGQGVVYFAVYEAHQLYLYALKLADGTPMNASWPVIVDAYEPYFIGLADVSGDAAKELVVGEVRNYYVGVPADEVAGPRLRVYDQSGALVWLREFPVEFRNLGELASANVDGSGKDEIIVGWTGQIVKGDNTFLSGWDTPGVYRSVKVVQRASGNPFVALSDFQGNVTLKNWQGVEQAGWPVAASGRLAVAQLESGGDEEIAVCGTSITVLRSDGTPPAGWSDIDLAGDCGGLEVRDVDGDSQPELVALVHRYTASPAPTDRVGSFLEVYEMDGSRWADTDTRWPMYVPIPTFYTSAELGRHIALGDVDGDSLLEAVQLLRIQPFATNIGAPSVRIEVLDMD